MLSKSRYLAGLQCAKRLWIETHERGSLPAVDDATQALFDQGHEVGKLAQRLFPGGLELDRRVRVRRGASRLASLVLATFAERNGERRSGTPGLPGIGWHLTGT